MTILIAMLCTDGAVVAADRAFTPYGMDDEPIGEILGTKIRTIDGGGLWGFVGDIGPAETAWNQLIKIGTGRPRSRGQVREDVQATLSRAPMPLLDRLVREEHFVPEESTAAGWTLAAVGEGVYVSPSTEGAAVVSYRGSERTKVCVPDRCPFIAEGVAQSSSIPFLRFTSELLFDGALPDVSSAKIGLAWTMDYLLSLRVGVFVGGGWDIGVCARSQAGQWSSSMVDAAERENLSAISASMRERLQAAFRATRATPAPAPQPPRFFGV